MELVRGLVISELEEIVVREMREDYFVMVKGVGMG